MTIVLLTTGSRGDTQPYVALGLALKAEGHTVKVAASEGFQDLIAAHGLVYARVRGDVSQIASSELTAAARKADNPLKFFSSMRNKTLVAMLVAMHEDLHAACDGADAVVYHPGAAVGYFAAKQMGVPSILASPFPIAPTSEYPALLFYTGPRLGRCYNRLTHAVFAFGFWTMIRDSLAQYWKNKHGRLPDGYGAPFRHQLTASHPTIVSCSPSVFPSPGADSIRHRGGPGRTLAHHDGYWFLDAPTEYIPDPALQRFLGSGPPPVYVGFGSVGDAAAAAETTRIVIDALRRVGTRALLATGWSGMDVAASHDPDAVHFISDAPHAWLFPKVSVAVHHGGAGTTAAALRAGIPSVIVPHGNDQFAWGARVHELGVGSNPVPRKRLTSERLADAIEYCRRADVRARSAALGEQIRSERGAECSAEIVLEAIRRYAADRDERSTSRKRENAES